MRVIIICMPSAMTGKSTKFYGNNSGPELRKTFPESDYLLCNLSFRSFHRTLGLTPDSVVKIHYKEK